MERFAFFLFLILFASFALYHCLSSMTFLNHQMEVIVGSGVWINTKVFERIVLQVDSSKKPPQQTLVKNLLTHLLGVEKYIETPAEKIDRRLMSAVVGSF